MVKHTFKFANGDMVTEKISGFTGTITGSAYYLTGCNQYSVVAKSKDNAEPTCQWYDEGRLELVKEQVVKSDSVKADDNGCDTAPPFGSRGY